MTVHFRRRPPSRAEEFGAAAVSILVGAGTAAVTWYVTRLLLSRERLGGDDEVPLLQTAQRRARLRPATAASDTED